MTLDLASSTGVTARSSGGMRRRLFGSLACLIVLCAGGCGGGTSVAPPCDSSNPGGACGSGLVCVGGVCCNASAVCGATCCAADQTCAAGQCSPARSDGGSPDGGGPSCSAATCAGCCAGTICIPFASEGNGQCGASGAACAACPANKYCDGTTGLCHASHVEHVVLIVQENHTFDSYFGKYCGAPAGTDPTCTSGPACCEGPPRADGGYVDPSGFPALSLDDDPQNPASNRAADRDHNQACELQQLNGGAMNHFVAGATGAATCFGVGPNCADPKNWALADGSTATSAVNYYWSLASTNALADRYFQPIAGGSASNNIYFAGAHFRFVDNGAIPGVSAGAEGSGLCVDSLGCLAAPRATYPFQTVADLLIQAGYTFAVYADGYAEAEAAAVNGACPGPASECPYSDCVLHPVDCHGCLYDPADIPFLYYQGFADSALPDGGVQPTPYERDLTELQQDLAAGTLPNFAFVKERLFHNEHPNLSTIARWASYRAARKSASC